MYTGVTRLFSESGVSASAVDTASTLLVCSRGDVEGIEDSSGRAAERLWVGGT